MTMIRNTQDLRTAIKQLKGQAADQQAALRARFARPKAIFKTVVSLFPHSKHMTWKSWIRPALRFIPAVTIRLFFRRSSFIIKSLLGLVGQLSSRFITSA